MKVFFFILFSAYGFISIAQEVELKVLDSKLKRPVESKIVEDRSAGINLQTGPCGYLKITREVQASLQATPIRNSGSYYSSNKRLPTSGIINEYIVRQPRGDNYQENLIESRFFYVKNADDKEVILRSDWRTFFYRRDIKSINPPGFFDRLLSQAITQDCSATFLVKIEKQINTLTNSGEVIETSPIQNIPKLARSFSITVEFKSRECELQLVNKDHYSKLMNKISRKLNSIITQEIEIIQQALLELPNVATVESFNCDEMMLENFRPFRL